MKFSEVAGAHGVDSEEYRQLKISPLYIDIPLLPEGVEQCEKS